MIFHFQTGDVTFVSEDQEYFEKRFLTLKRYLGWESGDEDTVEVNIKLEKNRHHTGERFEASSTIFAPHDGKFHAEVSTENIKKCADELHDKLKPQIVKFHEKHCGK